MSIYGSGRPVISSQLIGGDIPLDGTRIIRDPVKPERDQVMNKSVITGNKTLNHKGTHLRFKLTILNATRNLIDALSQTEGTEVSYQPYSDNPNRIMDCYLTKVDPFYFKKLNRMDAVKIEMETIDYWQDTASTLLDASGDNPIGNYEGYWVDENDDYIIDENGDKIIMNLYDKEA
jgi:hypothetical protein